MAGFAVYKVTSTETNLCYYGYGPLDSYQTTFMRIARNTDKFIIRGASMLFNRANCNEDNLDFVVEETCVDETEAWLARNNLRSCDAASVTKATPFPLHISRKFNNTIISKSVHSNWKANQLISSARTARIAATHGAFTFGQLKQLATTPAVKKQLVTDLDVLSPKEFSTKYDIAITFKIL